MKSFIDIGEEDTGVVLASKAMRTIYLTGPIDFDTVGHFMAALDDLLAQGGDESFYIKICSPGGTETAGFAIYDAIQVAKDRKDVYFEITAFGECSSIAALILQAGDWREMSPECRLMIHDGTIDLPDTEFRTAKTRVAEMEYSTSRYLGILAKKSGVDIDDMVEWSRSERYMGAKEAAQLGLIDCVTDVPDGEQDDET